MLNVLALSLVWTGLGCQGCEDVNLQDVTGGLLPGGEETQPVPDAGPVSPVDAGWDAGDLLGPELDGGTPVGPPDANTPGDEDAGPASVDGGMEPPGVAHIVGRLTLDIPGCSPSVLHPVDPLALSTVHIKVLGEMTDAYTTVTDSMGNYAVEVESGRAYHVSWNVPTRAYSEPDYARIIVETQAGLAYRVDYSFIPRGISYVVRDGATSERLSGVEITFREGGTVVGGPYLTDAEGCAVMPSATQDSAMHLSKAGYNQLVLHGANYAHTVVGGCILQPMN